jgi:hypothetical protein
MRELSDMDTGFSLLEEWYRQRYNGDWEHAWGIKIETLDNPGWKIKINLNETRVEDKTLQRVRIQRSEDDWIDYRAEKRTFHAGCGPLNLCETIRIFVDWFES